MALQFLREGVEQGETVLYVTLSETEAELREVAASHGWSLEGIHIHELFPMGDQLDPEEQYTMFHPSEVELGKVTQGILSEVERLQPQRVVFDSLSEIRLLAGSLLRFRRQMLALKQYFPGATRRSCCWTKARSPSRDSTRTRSCMASFPWTSCGRNSVAIADACA